MRYRAENDLGLFEFHDAELSFLSFDKNELVLSAKHLNIHKNAARNPYDFDMEIDFARILFTQFEVASYRPMRAYQEDDDGKLYTDEPEIIYNGKEAEKHFLNELKNSITIYCIDIRKQGNKNLIELSTCAQTCFFAVFTFEEVVVEWNEYCKKAWYELNNEYFHKGYLITPGGEEETEIHIVHHLEDTCYRGKSENGPSVSVGVKYLGEWLWGQGKDHLWADAFADVKKKLPDGIILKCCMTCRYGNMCPYGNEPGMLFCTKDLVINSKEELCNLFDDPVSYSIDVKAAADNCDKYAPQTRDHYTYNDYFYYLDK